MAPDTLLGFNHSCSGEGIVYDECNRRCHCKVGRPSDCYRIRKEFTEMSFRERLRYVRAFKAISTEDPYNRTYDALTALHPIFFKVIHEKKFFFPWHRWYLYQFENLLRRVDCRVTVPYWNWARAVSENRLWRHTGLRDIWNPGTHGFGGNGDSRSGCVQSGPFKEGKWSLPTWLNSECLSREFDYDTDLPGQRFVNNLNRITWSRFSRMKLLLTVCTMIFMMLSAEQCLKMNLPLHLNSGVTTPSWIKSGPTGKIVALNTNLHIIGV